MTKIQWTEKTWNPVTGCNKVSQGCKYCYAEIMHRRLMKMQPKKYTRPFLDGAFPDSDSLTIPMRWKKPAKIFVNSMSDLFHKDIPFEYIDKVFAVMAMCPQHIFQILTKRIDRALEYFNSRDLREKINECINVDEVLDNYSDWWEEWEGTAKELPKLPKHLKWDYSTGRDGIIDDLDLDYIGDIPLKNVWIGTSVENQKTANERIPILLQTPAVIRWISAEPLLGKITLTNISPHGTNLSFDSLTGKKRWGEFLHLEGIKLDWVVVGGESGQKARVMYPEWVRFIRDQCKSAGVPFFFKQWGEWGLVPQENIYPGVIEMLSAIEGNCKDVTFQKRIGRKAAGRMLDGIEYNEMPNRITV